MTIDTLREVAYEVLKLSTEQVRLDVYNRSELKDMYNIGNNKELADWSLKCWSLFKKSSSAELIEFVKKSKSISEDNVIISTPLVSNSEIPEGVKEKETESAVEEIRKNIENDINLIEKLISKDGDYSLFFKSQDHSLLTYALILDPLSRKFAYLKKFLDAVLHSGTFSPPPNLLDKLSKDALKKQFQTLASELNYYLSKKSGALLSLYKDIIEHHKILSPLILIPGTVTYYPLIHECTHALVAMTFGIPVSFGFVEENILGINVIIGFFTAPDQDVLRSMTISKIKQVYATSTFAPFITDIVLASVFYILSEAIKRNHPKLSGILLGLSMISYVITFFNIGSVFLPFSDITLLARALDSDPYFLALGVLIFSLGVFGAVKFLTRNMSGEKNPDVKDLKTAYGKNADKIVNLLDDFNRLFFLESNKSFGPIIYSEPIVLSPSDRGLIGQSLSLNIEKKTFVVKKVLKYLTIDEIEGLLARAYDYNMLKACDKVVELAHILYPNSNLPKKWEDLEEAHKEKLSKVLRFCQEYHHSSFPNLLALWNTIRTTSEDLPEIIIDETTGILNEEDLMNSAKKLLKEKKLFA